MSDDEGVPIDGEEYVPREIDEDAWEIFNLFADKYPEYGFQLTVISKNDPTVWIEIGTPGYKELSDER